MRNEKSTEADKAESTALKVSMFALSTIGTIAVVGAASTIPIALGLASVVGIAAIASKAIGNITGTIVKNTGNKELKDKEKELADNLSKMPNYKSYYKEEIDSINGCVHL